MKNEKPRIEEMVAENLTDGGVPLPAGKVGEQALYSGLGVSPGIAIGVAYVHNPGIVTVPKYRIFPEQIEKEQNRLTTAVEKTQRQLRYLRNKADKMAETSGEELGYLLDAYGQMLKNSRLIRGATARIANEQINAEAAVQTEVSALAEAFASMEDAYLAARMEDVRAVGLRLMRNLSHRSFQPFARLPQNSIIIANELTPADTALLDPKKVAGFATRMGGAQSHTGLLARSLGLPAAIGVNGLLSKVRTGDPVIIDGTYGLVIVCPSQEEIDKFSNYRQDFEAWRESQTVFRDLVSVTRDEHRVHLKGNIDLPSETEVLLQSGGEGIGLLRTEYMFMNRQELPTENEQFEALRAIVQRMDGQPVTIRTLDVGGDKPSDLVNLGTTRNPALGLRGVRCSLRWPELLETQIAAILRAGYFGPVKIMLPMISNVGEIETVRGIVNNVAERLRSENIDIPEELPPLGVMIEVPSAAICADTLAWHADFFSIGTNDLTQYTLAIDRTDESVAPLFNPVHPSVLRLIQFAVEAARKARIPVGVCGEVAANPQNTALLVGLGVTELSMPATNIPLVKERVRAMSLADAKNFAAEIMNQSNPARVHDMLAHQHFG